MKQYRRYISLVFNIIIVVFTLIGVFVIHRVDPGQNFNSGGLVSLKYFTVLSNVFCGIVALVWLIFFFMKKTFPVVFKLMAVSAVGITFLMVAAFLAPTYPKLNLYEGRNLWFHLIIPLIAIPEFIVLETEEKIPFKYTFISASVTLVYGLGYLINILINGVGQWPDTNDWYGFLNWGYGVGTLIFAATVLANFAVACLMRALNIAVNKLPFVPVFIGLIVITGLIGFLSYRPGTEKVEAVTQLKNNHYKCTFDGIEHIFIVDMPEKTEGSPLVLMLHGYGQNAEVFRSTVGFEKDAVNEGYTVVYVTGATSPEDKTSAVGWNAGVRESSNRDVEFLKAMVQYMAGEYGIDKTKVFAVGFSNGAFMCHRLACEAEDTFAAVVSVSGMMPESVWESKPEACDIGVFQITGEKDDLIPKNSDGSASVSKDPAIEDVMNYYVTANGLELSEEEMIGKKKETTFRKYTGKSGKQVWDIFIKDGRHSWPNEGVTGINMNQMILDYFGCY